MSISEILVILLVVFIFFGGSNLTQIMKDIAKSVRVFKDEIQKKDKDKD